MASYSRSSLIRLVVIILVTFGLSDCASAYRWSQATVGGGGYITGVYPHPTELDLVYLRTDMGGFYRWNAATQGWTALVEAFDYSQSNYYGGEGLALDPNDPDVVYIAAGKHSGSTGALFKSTDRGTTWTRLTLELPMGGNEHLRWAGERLVVDPHNSTHLYFGSRQNGLWQSTDAGATWAQVPLGANLTAGIGILSVAFDGRVNGMAYINTYDGIYKSTGGATWNRLAGSPVQALRMAVANNGRLYVSHQSGVSTYAISKGKGVWKTITPGSAAASFDALSVNPSNPSDVLVATDQSTSTRIYRSLNGGSTWTQLSMTLDNTLPWFDAGTFTHATAAIAFDPVVAGRVWLSDWYGVYQTNDINTQPVTWHNFVAGIEQLVVFGLAIPADGPWLLSAVADLDGFAHDQGPSAPPSRTFGGNSGPWYQDTYSIDTAGGAATRAVRVGGNRWTSPYTEGWAVSTDSGLTWSSSGRFTPGVMPLRVAIAANDPDRFIVLTSGAQPLYTRDGGSTWNPVSGLPDGPTGPWYWGQPLAADRVDGNVYYYSTGKLYRSEDGGASFNIVNTSLPIEDWSEAWSRLKAVDGMRGELWLSRNWQGLHHSMDGGATFTKLSNVEQAYLFALGKPREGSTVPTLYLYGTVSGMGQGIFLSLDRGETWTEIGDPALPIGNEPNVMEASPRQFGLVFIGTNGRGIYYGEP